MKKSKKKDKFFPKIEVTRENSKRILDLFAKKLGIREFIMSFSEDDTPSISLSVAENSWAENDGNIETSCSLVVGEVRSISGRLEAGERGIGVWWADGIYAFGPVMFKPRASMTLDDFSFWMRVDLDRVREECCKALLDRLCEAPYGRCIWRMWQGHEWIEIDPWKFAIELDLEG